MNKKKCILLVDDDDISNFLAKKVITTLQLSDNIYSAKNGREALTFIDEHCDKEFLGNQECTYLCPDLVLLDINMPVMNGLEFLKEFYHSSRIHKGCFKEIMIYVLTSSENPRDKEIVKSYNVKGYINKPLTLESLKELT